MSSRTVRPFSSPIFAPIPHFPAQSRGLLALAPIFKRRRVHLISALARNAAPTTSDKPQSLRAPRSFRAPFTRAALWCAPVQNLRPLTLQIHANWAPIWALPRAFAGLRGRAPLFRQPRRSTLDAKPIREENRQHNRLWSQGRNTQAVVENPGDKFPQGVHNLGMATVFRREHQSGCALAGDSLAVRCNYSGFRQGRLLISSCKSEAHTVLL